MTEDQVATVVTVFAVVLGMFFALVAGYVMGYKDAKRHREKDNEQSS